jgi:hypothetical protein
MTAVLCCYERIYEAMIQACLKDGKTSSEGSFKQYTVFIEQYSILSSIIVSQAI